MFECLKADISASVKNEVKNELKAELTTDIQNEVANRVAASHQHLSARCDRLEALCQQQQKILGGIPDMIDMRLTNQLDQRDHQVAVAVQTVQKTEDRLCNIESRVENSDKCEGMNTLILEGVRPTRGRPVKEIVCDIIYNETSFTLHPDDLHYASRFGLPLEDGTIAIKACFFDWGLKMEVLKKKSRLRNSKLIIREHLTQSQNDLFNQSKLARKKACHEHQDIYGPSLCCEGPIRNSYLDP